MKQDETELLTKLCHHNFAQTFFSQNRVTIDLHVFVIVATNFQIPTNNLPAISLKLVKPTL